MLIIEQRQLLYEIALSIGTSLDLKSMLETAMLTILKRLDCSAGAIHHYQEEQLLYAYPAHIEANEIYQQARVSLSKRSRSAFPIQSEGGRNAFFYIFKLPEFGTMILIKQGQPLETSLIESFPPLLDKLAKAGQACLKNQRLISQTAELSEANELLIQEIFVRERMEKTLSIVFNTVGEGIIITNEAGIVVMVNREIENIWGYRQYELIGQSFQKLLPEEKQLNDDLNIKQYFESKEIDGFARRLVIDGLKKNGSVFPLELNVTETKIEETVMYTAAVRDITRRQEMEKLRDNFVATISHELRTPLTSVLGFLEIILNERPGPLNELQQRFLQNCYQGASQLFDLIEELLKIYQIQENSFEITQAPFSPSEVIKNVRESVSALMEEKAISCQVREQWPAETLVMGDQKRLEQVLMNLVGNAIKFTPPSGEIEISSCQRADEWYCQISDTGMGIPEKDIPYLFQRFYRAQNAAQAQIQGTGLGLYICKAIVNKHGGRIGVKSELDQGTTIWFTIPIAEIH